MKNLVLVTTILYALVGIYFLYMACLQLYVLIANYFEGYNTPKGSVLWYSFGAISVALLTYQGYLILYQSMDTSWRKWIFFSPFIVLIIYGLWALLLVISSGGKWN